MLQKKIDVPHPLATFHPIIQFIPIEITVRGIERFSWNVWIILSFSSFSTHAKLRFYQNHCHFASTMKNSLFLQILTNEIQKFQ